MDGTNSKPMPKRWEQRVAEPPTIERQMILAQFACAVVMGFTAWIIPSAAATEAFSYAEVMLADIHTVYVPKGERASWLVLEGRENPDYDPTCFTLADLSKFDFSTLYKPMDTATVERHLRENDCALVELAVECPGAFGKWMAK